MHVKKLAMRAKTSMLMQRLSDAGIFPCRCFDPSIFELGCFVAWSNLGHSFISMGRFGIGEGKTCVDDLFDGLGL
jgi:hypothetical protein